MKIASSVFLWVIVIAVSFSPVVFAQSNDENIDQVQPFYYSNLYVYCDVPVIKQATEYYCGPATVLQTLYGFGRAGLVTGSTDTAKQHTLAANMGTTTVGTDVDAIRDELNKYVTLNKKYKKELASSMTIYSFGSKVNWSLYHKRPPILHAKTQSLWYYYGKNMAHYINIDRHNYPENKVRLADCNWYDKYRGHWWVPISQALDTIKPYGRFLIYHDNPNF